MAGVLATPEALADRKARLAEEPIASWWKEAHDAADALLAQEKPPQAQHDLARGLETLAFAHAMADDARYAERAGAWFAGVRAEAYATGEPKNGVLADAEAAKSLAVAYDLVGGPAGVLREVAKRMEAYDPGWYRGHQNNWQVRQFSAVGVLALALGDEKQVARALSHVKYALMYQTCDDGAFAEGHSYLAYSAEEYIPFAWALRNAGKEDLFAWPTLAKAHRWSALSRLPDGRRPNFDDAHLAYFPSQAVPDPLMRWDWEHFAERGHPGLGAIESIAYFAPIEAKGPEGEATVVFPDGGDVLFRTGWDAGASMLVLRAEHGKARLASQGHEHPDNLSFIYVTRGRMALIDSGYINYEEHGRVNKAQNHNVILVDGVGPPVSNDVEIVESAPTRVRLRTTYAGATIERTATWAEGRMTFEDEIDAPQAKEVAYLFHVMPGGPEVSIEIDPPMTWSESEAEHSFEWGKAAKHVVRRAAGPPGRYTVRIGPK